MQDEDPAAEIQRRKEKRKEQLTKSKRIAVSHSELATFRSCRRRHWLQYVERLEPVRRHPALSFGDAWHKILEAYFRAAQARGHWALPTAAEIATAAEGKTLEDEFDLARLSAMTAAYHERWNAPSPWSIDPSSIVDVEAYFRLPLVNPITGATSQRYDLHGVIDAVLDIGGESWLMEHKSTGEKLDPGSSYFTKLRGDAQCSIYLLGGAHLIGKTPTRPMPRGIIYDVIAKPKIRPLEVNQKRAVPETAAEYAVRCHQWYDTQALDRRPVVRLAGELTAAHVDIYNDVREMHASTIEGRATRNPDSCFAWYRECEFHPVCWGGVDPHASPLYQIRKNDKFWNHAKKEEAK